MNGVKHVTSPVIAPRTTSTSKGFIRHKHTKAKQKHAYYIIMTDRGIMQGDVIDTNIGGGVGIGNAPVLHHVPIVRLLTMGLLPDTYNCGLRMRRECFPRHRGLAIPTCITACASRTCRDACRDRLLAVPFEVGGGETIPGILVPDVCATPNYTYPARGLREENHNIIFSIVLLSCRTSFKHNTDTPLS